MLISLSLSPILPGQGEEMLDFSRQGNKNIGNNRAKRRDVAKEKGEENKKKVLVCAMRLRRGNSLGSTGHFDHFPSLHRGENLGQEAIKLLQAKKSF